MLSSIDEELGGNCGRALLGETGLAEALLFSLSIGAASVLLGNVVEGRTDAEVDAVSCAVLSRMQVQRA